MQVAANSLNLCYGALSSRELSNASDRIKALLEPTSIYIIAKRKRPFFEILSRNENEIKILYRLDSSKVEITLFLNSTLLNELEYNNGEISIDRLVYLQHHDELQVVSGHGAIGYFLTYEVLYVGQCVKEHIVDRFKAHHALLKIFNNEPVFSTSCDKSEEIIILPFMVNSCEITSVNAGSSTNEIDRLVSLVLGDCCVPEEAFLYDCEKALIHAMDPRYNKTKFNSYPESTDGLYPFYYDSIGYAIDENIILSYNNSNKIFGGDFGRSLILIKNNKDFEIISKT